MKIVVQRTITGSIYIAVIIVSLIIHPVAFAIVTALLNFAGLFELNKLGRPLLGEVYPAWVWINSIAFLAFGLSLSLGIKLNVALIPFILLSIILLILPIYKNEKNAVGNILLPFFGAAYISLPLVLLNLIHQKSEELMIPVCLALFIIIWTNDTFAYLSGMAFGKHRLFERISPKKSWEGFAGGLIMGAVSSVVFYYFFPEFGLAKWIYLSILISCSGVLGDLFESLLKRISGVKDSGSILPGHGGILDRIDSVLLVGPVVYLYLMLI